MGVIEQVSRYDEQVGALRSARQKHYTEQIAQSIRQLQRHGMADPALDPVIAAAALGLMTTRFAEFWLVEGTVDCSLEDAVEQLTNLYVNAMKSSSRADGSGRRPKTN
jgi:hypothetical protein